MLHKDISQEETSMLFLSTRFPPARGLVQAALLLALAGCSARAIHEQQPPALPGVGTYTWEVSGVEPVPGTTVSAPASAAEDHIRAAIDNGLTHRGYEQRPETEATWRVSYRSSETTRKEQLAPRDRMLQPRMICNPPMECMIIQEWVHFGPPKYAENKEYTIAESTVQVQIHDAKTGQLIWQGRTASDLDENGQPDTDILRKNMKKLLRTLPSVRQKTARANVTPPPATDAATPAVPVPVTQ
jgi:hypothetical protein